MTVYRRLLGAWGKDLGKLRADRRSFSALHSQARERGWGMVGADLCKGGWHCVDRGSALGRLHFGAGTQLIVIPGE